MRTVQSQAARLHVTLMITFGSQSAQWKQTGALARSK